MVESLQWELSWWGDCRNTFGEEYKQILYAQKMGLQLYHNKKSPYNIKLEGDSILDIGGGPTSLLLKVDRFEKAMVIDPLMDKYPQWIRDRYKSSFIDFQSIKGEDLDQLKNTYDEVWIYNVLQHVEEPYKIIKLAQRIGKLIRIFEWVETETNIGHPHSLSEKQLNEWLHGEGKTEQLTGQSNCYGKCYYGIFPT